VVKHVDAAELRVVVAAVLAVATDAVLVAQHLLKLGAHLATALARLNELNLAPTRAMTTRSTTLAHSGSAMATKKASMAREEPHAAP
jgi:DNA anti-recombination protein RmuC